MNYDNNNCNTLCKENYRISFNLIECFMTSNNLTIDEFCKNCNITTSEYYKIKNQDYHFEYLSLVKISIFTNISIKELIADNAEKSVQTIFLL